MSQRSELLEHERRKLSLLRDKLADQERRVKVLEQMQDDPLDAILEKELATAAPTVQQAAPVMPPAPPTEVAKPLQHHTDLIPAPISSWQRIPRRRLPEKWSDLLSFIGSEGKTFTEVEKFIGEANLALSPGAARTGLMNYRKDFGFVENPRKGFYRATDKALAFIEAHKDESPAIEDDRAFESQPIPLARAEA